MREINITIAKCRMVFAVAPTIIYLKCNDDSLFYGTFQNLCANGIKQLAEMYLSWTFKGKIYFNSPTMRTLSRAYL